jgi:hypothetical protein
MAVRNEHYYRFLFIGFVLSLVVMGMVWHFGVRQLVPADERFAIPSLFHTWFYAPDSSAYLDRVGRWFLAVGYPYYFTLVVPFGVALYGGFFAVARGTPESVVHALVGCLIGAVIGLAIMTLMPRLAPAYADPWWTALAMPGLALAFGLLAPRVMLSGYRILVVRGTLIRHHRPQGRGAVNRAVARRRTALAGIILGREAEARHIAAIGVTGSGKSTVLRGPAVADHAACRPHRLLEARRPAGVAVGQVCLPRVPRGRGAIRAGEVGRPVADDRSRCLRVSGMPTLTGGCFCGAIRDEADGVPFHQTNCHCSICRRTTGAPFVAWFSVQSDGFGIIKGQPARFSSSEKRTRSFCARCGTQLTFEHADFGDEIDVTTCSLDDPELVPPWDNTRARAAGSDGLFQTACRNTRKAGSKPEAAVCNPRHLNRGAA